MSNRCRLCLCIIKEKIDIFKNDFPKMIEILTGIKVEPYEDWPKESCLDCAKNVKIALKTRQQIIRSYKLLIQEHLLGRIKSSKPKFARIRADHIYGDKAIVDEVNASDNHTSKLNVPERTITRSQSRLNIVVQRRIDTEHKVCVSEASTVSLPIVNESEDNIETRETLVHPNNPPSVDSPSPPSNTASDVDWEPNKHEQKKENEPFITATKTFEPPLDASTNISFVKKHRSSPKTTKTLPKGSDGVFFIKKLKTTDTARRLKSPETIVRIKKKPKGRVPPTRVTCDICKREVQSYWLQKHMETHEYNPVTCEFCGLVSKSATALRHHVFYYHRSAADKYMCDQCGRSFRSKYRLNLHKKKEHGGTKDFECTTCGKKFFERMHLKRHVDKTHMNIRPYVCDFCGKSFKSKNHIKIHERIHSKEAPYNCHMCGESFKMKLTLRTHLKGVHNVREDPKVFCDICKRGFASNVALKAHLNSRIHETEKCQYCSEMFTREYMINHLRDVHKLGETS